MHEQLFPSQQPDEKILLVLREHWFRLAAKVIVVAVLSLVPAIVGLLLSDTSFGTQSDVASAVVSTFISIYYLSLLVALFVIFVLYYLNLHIVSEQRIVDIDQRGLLFHEISELNIETIEDVTSQTKGLFGNILNYGTVYIQTAGTSQKFEFENIPDPSHVAKIILELYEAHGGKFPSKV